MKPIKPFEPVSSTTIPPSYLAQVKWDGVRVLAYFEQELTLFNRSLNERTNTYPELHDLPDLVKAKSFIFDGEIVALNEKGEPSFHDVMRRDRLKKDHQIARGVVSNPIFYMIFDVVYWDGEWVNERPLFERLALLKNGLEENNSIRIVQNHEDGNKLYEVIKEKGMEGIVCKDVNSPYVINGKSANWMKIKNYKDIYALVCGVTFRGKSVNTLLLCLYDSNKKLRYIGSAGTGKLKSDEIADFSSTIESLQEATSQVIDGPQQSGVTWVSPKIIVKVTYLEWTSDLRLRQPVVQTIVEGDPTDCTLQQT